VRTLEKIKINKNLYKLLDASAPNEPTIKLFISKNDKLEDIQGGFSEICFRWNSLKKIKTSINGGLR